MNKSVIASFENEKWEFYDLEGNQLNDVDVDNSKIYVILPDRLFFFFQSDITTKRKASKTIKAFALSNFVDLEGFVGYLRFHLPLIGYVVKEFENEKIKQVLEKAEAITTPFCLYLFFNNSESFCYKCGDVFARYINGSLMRYSFTNDECIDENAKNINCSKEETIRFFIEAIKQRKYSQVNLPTSEVEAGGFENWNITRFALLIVALIVFIAGDVLRYEYYVKQNKKASEKLQKLYGEALGPRHYSDPYGVLLYMASTGINTTSFKPLNIIVALSRAKDDSKISINSIEFDGSNLKISGIADNYSTLAAFLGKVNKFLNKQLSIDSTKFTSKGLKFILSGGASL